MTKIILTALTLLNFTLPAEARSRGYAYAYAEANSYDLEHSIMQAALERVVECTEEKLSTCKLEISPDSKNKVKDFISLQHKLAVKVIPSGLEVNTKASVECNQKVAALMTGLTYREVNDKQMTITKAKIFKDNASWAKMCTLTGETYQVNLYKLLIKDADIATRNLKTPAPMAFSEEYHTELWQLVKELEKVFGQVRVEVRSYPVAVKTQYLNWFDETVTKWDTKNKELPVSIEYSKPRM